MFSFSNVYACLIHGNAMLRRKLKKSRTDSRQARRNGEFVVAAMGKRQRGLYEGCGKGGGADRMGLGNSPVA